jgi:asparagine synthase (glutamine-hydrolysing)
MLIPNIIGNADMEDSDPGGYIVRYGCGPPVIDVYGLWQEGEFSQHQYRDAILLVIGHCLIEESKRADEFARAVERSPESRTSRAIADWPGSYSAAVLRRDGVEAYADLAGQFPVYYSRRGDEVLIGSDPRFLAARHKRYPDPVTAAVHIACPAVLPLWSGRSPYSDVARLEGGSVLRVKSSGSLVVESSRWPHPAPDRTRAEGAAALRQALVGAVRARCSDQVVSSDFSGGLDSTSIAFLAAAASAAEDLPLTSVLYHQPLAPAGDLTHAVRFADLDPRINLVIANGSKGTLPFSSVLPSSEVESLPEPIEPAPQALSGQAAALRLGIASSSGARLHLTGEGADAVLLPSPSYLGTLARPRLTRTLLRHCVGYAQLRYTSPAVLAQRAIRLAHTTPVRALGQLARELQRPDGRPLNWADLISWWTPSGEAATWLTPGMRRQLAEIAGDPATARVIPDDLGPADVAALADLRRSGDAHRYLRRLGASMGLAVHAPFLDADVIRATLSVPALARTEPWSYKPLLREAMAGLVPAEVLSRRTKGDYSAEDYRGARSSAGALRGLLRDSRLADLGVIESGAVESVIDRMTSGIAVPMGPINMLLATEVWLRGTEAKAGVPVRC